MEERQVRIRETESQRDRARQRQRQREAQREACWKQLGVPSSPPDAADGVLSKTIVVPSQDTYCSAQ